MPDTTPPPPDTGHAPPRLVVVASYMRDVGIDVDRFPEPGETRIGGRGQESPGGKGSNQAIQAARCGARVTVLAAVGDDSAGAAARALWRAEGIDERHVQVVSAESTGLAVILIDAIGQNQIVIAPGANRSLTADAVARARDSVHGAAMVLSQLESPWAVTQAAFEAARRAGVPTMLNAAPAPDMLPDALWSSTDWLVVNEIEGAALAGLGVDAAPAAIGAALLARGVRGVVFTQGAQGAWVFEPRRTPIHRAALPVEVIDTTGAGDAFIGAFARHWAATHDAAAALTMGVAAGSLACTVRGAVPALATGEAIRRAAAR